MPGITMSTFRHNCVLVVLSTGRDQLRLLDIKNTIVNISFLICTVITRPITASKVSIGGLSGNRTVA